MTDETRTLPPADRRSAFANAPMGIALATTTGLVVDANPALAAMVGRSAGELYGHSMLDLVHPDDHAAAVEAFAELLELRRMMRHETRLVRADGSVVPVQVTSSWVDGTPEGDPPHVVAIVEDITERKALEASLVHRSLHDPLTGLPNRILFRDRLRHALERGHRERTATCVLGIDLDGFKEINDRYGHPVGDAVLVAVAERLTSVLRASDTAARVGGDEFSIVCENSARADAEVLAARLRSTVTEPLRVGDVDLPIGMSIGIGTVPGGTDPERALERLVREADDAMYADKAARRR
ncbi:PAS domain S-box-containing protein/diguanylate cyclase (GGDEF) domain-containing protein [Geodermatophilus pulveris]|uniref:PAS domain S-box-containing protein/diguanylate cyclase (GGDEF) domain-containing protein n=1 Tax=Geodermatophilus pulveris TaxID=1564159 RepID=A0A239FUI9_9ACTN|nr:sensor domain-containing diguanylate cyclase [Geodermatophilus pulveris]SNS59802.1 PAS domain S-box-containing protein/diguanylate cyclase (GGDEF) domain-containing protein [Geodermatophilus pulveris]